MFKTHYNSHHFLIIDWVMPFSFVEFAGVKGDWMPAILELLRKYPSHANTELPNPRRRKKTGGELLADGLGRIADAVGPQQSWKEKTIELFWKVFGSEDMGFQKRKDRRKPLIKGQTALGH
jgi:hypothetical protein